MEGHWIYGLMNKLPITKSLKSAIYFLLVLTILLACQKNIQPEDPPPAEGELVATARNFIYVFLKGEKSEVMALSAMPFLMADRALLTYPSELQQVLDQFYLNRELPAFTILKMDVQTPTDMESRYPKTWAKLMEYGFNKYHYVFSLLRLNDSINEEVLLILKWNQGEWKVVGYVS